MVRLSLLAALFWGMADLSDGAETNMSAHIDAVEALLIQIAWAVNEAEQGGD